MTIQAELGLKNHWFGLSVESMFDQKCREFAINVRSSIGKSAWDREVEISGEWRKVQIKATRTLSRVNRGDGEKTWAYVVATRRESVQRHTYDESGVDFMAIYVAPISRWFILETWECNANKLRITRNPIGKMKVATERWELLGAIRP